MFPYSPAASLRLSSCSYRALSGFASPRRARPHPRGHGTFPAPTQHPFPSPHFFEFFLLGRHRRLLACCLSHCVRLRASCRPGSWEMYRPTRCRPSQRDRVVSAFLSSCLYACFLSLSLHTIIRSGSTHLCRRPSPPCRAAPCLARPVPPTHAQTYSHTGRADRARVRRRKGRARAAHEGAQQRVERAQRASERDRAGVRRDGHVRALSLSPSFASPCLRPLIRLRATDRPHTRTPANKRTN